MSEVLSLDIWQWLAGPQAHELVERAAATAPTDVAGIERLRRLAAPERVRAAMLLAQARGKARDKWPAPVAVRIFADPEGVEMASSARAAAYKAQRLREGLNRSGFIGRTREPMVLDLCSGIGGDAMALAQCSDFRVVAVDRDPVRAWMAGLNAGCDSLVRGLDETSGALANLPDAAAVHLDPARRHQRSDGSRSRRIVSLADHEP
ncbi:MAG TPA: class I SAM-dependent methyltransferase, partial [Phycisphaerales bacterium]|nr:class I SAM-dependent methyltransferase [Phycisphaerales bacterium]